MGKGGVVFGYEKLSQDKEKIYFNSEDTHTLGIGATRSGKTRCIVLPTISTLLLGGESIVATDPKGELYDYTADFAKSLGYKVLVLDFKEPKKSDRYNFLQPVIDAINRDDIQDAIDKAWDITESLMPDNDRSEPIWKNGEASIICSSILTVCFENKKRYEYQNLANVYDFISKMSVYRFDNNKNSYVLFEKLSEYLKEHSKNNPAIGLLAISEVAHPKTRSSFYTSALTTLRLFTNLNINTITSDTNINLKDIGREKTILYIILPDEKKTFYSIASLFVHQLYISLVEQADRLGGVLKQRVNFVLDEFGNFTKIPNMDTKLTVSGSRGIRFNLFLQSFSQLDEKYGKDVAKIIRYNCENWIYIQTDDKDTLSEISGRLGKYTTTGYSISAQSGSGISGRSSSSSSVQLQARELLTADEVKRIQRPYILYLSRAAPAIMYCPDISKWKFNDLLGMGDKEHNIRLRFMRGLQREEKIKYIKKPEYWEDIIYRIELFELKKREEALEKNIANYRKMLPTSTGNTILQIKNAISLAENELNTVKEESRELRFKINELEKKEKLKWKS